MRCWRSAFLLVMNRFSRPAWAQSSAMEVVTLPPPTIRDSTATATSTALPEASIVPSLLYPVGNPILNNIDTLVVNYISPWSEVQMTVSCGATADDPNDFSFRADKLPQNGPYDLSPIQQSFNPSRYPIYCHITLEDATNSQNTINGAQFIMTSASGSPSLYAQTTTAAIPETASNTGTATNPSTTNTSSPNNNDNDNNSDSASLRPSLTTSSSPNPTAEGASSSSSTSTTISSSSGGLSPGAKAGIAISILLFLALLCLFIFFLLRYRRKLRTTQSQLAETQASAAAMAAQHADEKAYLDSILAVAGKPDTSKGGRIVVKDLGDRKSGDWRGFFASKANSAANSAKAAMSSVGGSRGASRAGSRANSRPGSRRMSRLNPNSRPTTSGTDVEAVPDVPSLPSPSLVGGGETASVTEKGEGSTVGLVSGENEKPKQNIKRKPLRTPGQQS